jgi:hypothetical protein
LARQRESVRYGFSWRRDLLHQSPSLRIGGIEDLARHGKPPRPPHADPGGQGVEGAEIGHKADLVKGQGETRVGGGDDHIAGSGKRKPGADRPPLDGRDHGFLPAVDEPDDPVNPLQSLPGLGCVHVRHAADIAARAEAPIPTRNDDSPYLLLGHGLLQQIVQGFAHVERKRIALPGFVQPDQGNGAMPLNDAKRGLGRWCPRGRLRELISHLSHIPSVRLIDFIAERPLRCLGH